jgi:hypothetical protein
LGLTPIFFPSLVAMREIPAGEELTADDESVEGCRI